MTLPLTYDAAAFTVTLPAFAGTDAEGRQVTVTGSVGAPNHPPDPATPR